MFKAESGKLVKVAMGAALLSLSLFSFAFPASADNNGWGVNDRQTRQHNRIKDGVQDGELNKREAKRLRSREARLARREARLRASGNGLTQKERASLEKQQNAISKDIYEQKHDGQTR